MAQSITIPLDKVQSAWEMASFYVGLWTKCQRKKSRLGKLDLRGGGNEEKDEDI